MKSQTTLFLSCLLLVFIISNNINAQANYALDFDGVDDYVSTGYLPLANSSFTIEFWARQDAASLGRYRMIVSQGSATANNGLHIGYRDNNKFTFAFYGNDLDVQTATTDTEWHHWVCTYDASTNSRKIYQDGKLVASDNSASDFTGNSKLQIGYNMLSFNNYWDGQIDEVRIWNDERTHPEILSNMNLYLDGTETGLLANWRFDEGAGFTANDVKNSYVGYLEEMTDDDWVTSTIPFGTGENHWEQSILAPGNWTTFHNTGVRIYFTTLPDDEIVSVTKINGSPNVVPTDLDIVFDSQYWIVNRSSNDPISGDIKLSVAEDITDADNTDMRRIRLYDRTVNSDGAWSFVKNSDWIEATQDYATFNNLVAFQQFAYGRKITPIVSSLSPTDNTTEVEQSINLVINFEENVSGGSGNIYIKKYSDDSTVETISATACSISGAEVTINPINDLTLETKYYVIIENSAFKNASNTYFAGYLSKEDWNFTTKDNLQISSVNPANNSTDIHIATNLMITFEKDVSAGVGNIYIKKYSDDSTVEIIMASSCSISGAEVTINPINDLALETKYYVIIENTTFKDEYDNFFPGYSSKDDWNFTTKDNLQISSINPADNSTDVHIATNLIITFSRDVSAGSGNIYIKKYSDNSTAERIAASACSTSGAEVTINPINDLTMETEYYVIIENTTFKDEYDNYFTGYSSKDDWNFTTKNNLQISSVNPSDNSTGIDIATNLMITFSRDVTAESGNIYIKKYSDDSIVETIAASACSISGAEVTINPINDLATGIEYYIIIESNAFKDEYDSYFYGWNWKNDWNFRTSGLIPSSLYPADNETAFVNSANLIINFNRNTFAGTGNIYIKKSSDNSIVESIAASSCIISDAEVTINPLNDLEFSTGYYIEIENTAFMDVNNIYFAGYSSNDDWDFSTFDDFQPASVSPANNSTNIDRGSNLVINFNRNATATSNGNIYIRKYSDDSLFETILASSCSVSGSQVTVNHLNRFAVETKYYITIDDDAFNDDYGRYYLGISNKDEWVFTSLDKFQIVSTTPENNGTIDFTANFVIKFNRDVNIIGDGKVSLYKTVNDVFIESFLATDCAKSGTDVTINPTNDLESDTEYYIFIDNNAFGYTEDNYFEGYHDKNDWKFISTPYVYVNTLTPDNGNNTLNREADLVIDFNTSVSAGVGNVTIKKLSDNSIVETFLASSLHFSGGLVTINPTNDLVEDTEYYVLIDNTAFKDAANHYFAGFTSNNDWHFKTLANFTVSMLYPESGADNVDNELQAERGKLVLKFNRSANEHTLARITLYKDAPNFETIQSWSRSFIHQDYYNTVVYVSVQDNLEYGAHYYVVVKVNSFYDDYGNYFSGLNGYDWHFDVEADPNATPVELTSFNAELINSQIQLNWTTATEINNYGFEIERGILKQGQNDDNWEKIGFVVGHGNSNSPKEYSYIDTNPINGISQYRLKQIDTDGEFEYSDIVEVAVDLPTKYKLAQNYPNPFNPSTTISYSIPAVISNRASSESANASGDSSPQNGAIRNDNNKVTLKIYNILGQEVATLVNQKQVPGNYEVAFYASNLTSGVYIYRLVSGNFTASKKLLLTK